MPFLVLVATIWFIVRNFCSRVNIFTLAGAGGCEGHHGR